MPVALKELAEVYKLKNAFIVSDSGCWTSGIVEPVDDLLATFGLRTAEYFTVSEKPTVADVLGGMQKMEEFEPEAIVAVGGPNVMSVAKAMWLLYENPGEDLVTLSTKFNNPSKDPEKFPRVGKKAVFAAVSTGAGVTGANTPFIILKGENRDLTIASFDLLPEIDSIDSNFFMNMPEGTIKDTALKALAMAVAAYSDKNISDYAVGFAKDAVKAIVQSYDDAVNKGCAKAYENIAHAASIAELAFGNTIDTVNEEIKPFDVSVSNAKVDELAAYCGISKLSDVIK
jgi:acetaldehyde dehydrogenase/alcohol dehydrogenase